MLLGSPALTAVWIVGWQKSKSRVQVVDAVGKTVARPVPIRGRRPSERAYVPIASANSVDLLCSVLEASENECRVRTAEAETVRERVFHKRLARFVRHIMRFFAQRPEKVHSRILVEW
jgi:hypothetical protein